MILSGSFQKPNDSCLSTGEHACPVWNKWRHNKKVETTSNETCGITPLAV